MQGVKEDKSDREGSTGINRVVKEHFRQIKCDLQQCGGVGGQMGMWMSEKVTRNKAVCRGGHGPAYRRKGFVFIQGFDFYPKVNEF